MFDDISIIAITWLRSCPSVLISLSVYILCTGMIFFVNKYFKYIGLCSYIILCGVISNIQVLYVTKYEGLPLVVLLGTVVFSSTFLATDIISKEYGNKEAGKLICLSIVCNIFFVLNMLLMLGHKPFTDVDINENTKALAKIFVPQIRFTIASYISFLASQFAEIFFFKTMSMSKGIISHNISLFISSVIVDNIVFTLCAFVVFGDNSFTSRSAIEISISAIITRVLCNFLNTCSYKILFKH